ncbi:zinc finger CCCH domain-containing protein 13-like isoform X1 [Quillaja saponaria]|uniref:Zinc finger CCCH domain-containing protein 13-like isoform X1 n=1 Tax=Quillaja saponaria TaxID=32244 RepID=A0AAD7LJJ8_QUISA|nr:zinc finger CCCH domain-containing protein 13-like isoform X1 [Quillaja saponaria]
MILGDMSTERSSSSKASPMGLVERSPSSASIEWRYMNRGGIRRSLDIEESGRRGSIDVRDISTPEDRMNRELPLEKPLLDESSQPDSSFYGRTSQGNVIPPPPAFRAALDRPFMGSLEDDVRDHSHSRYNRRSSDPGFGRGHGNSWRGMPNWSPSVSNGFVPFQHGPSHGGFPPMMSQYPSQPLYGVRPPMEVNHSGIPYHIPDAERFSGHLRPLGWQNMMDSTAPSHLHGWVGNNGVLRDDSHMYGGSDWDRGMHAASTRVWESNAENWKVQNGDLKKDLPSPSRKDDFPLQDQVDDAFSGKAVQMSNDEGNHEGIHEKAVETKSSSLTFPEGEALNSWHTSTSEKTPDTSTASADDVSDLRRFYLSKLDISDELALPELYDQCTCLLNIGKSASVDDDATMSTYPEDGSRAGLKYSATLPKHSLFPVIDCSFFQRAIYLYKMQRLESHCTAFVTGGQLDIISASSQVKAEEQISDYSLRNIKERVMMTSNAETVNTLMCISDQEKLEAITPSAKEDLEELDITHGKEVQDLVQASSHENPGESLLMLGEKHEKVVSEEISGNEDETMPDLNNASQTGTILPISDDMNTKAEGSDIAYCGDGSLAFGDTVDGSLDCKDGSPKVCEVLMPGSSESESLILSRIHHSPESTH